MNPPPVRGREASQPRRHISQELAPSPFGRLPGLHWASPSTPLDVSSYVRGSIAAQSAAVTIGRPASEPAETTTARRIRPSSRSRPTAMSTRVASPPRPEKNTVENGLPGAEDHHSPRPPPPDPAPRPPPRGRGGGGATRRGHRSRRPGRRGAPRS